MNGLSTLRRICVVLGFGSTRSTPIKSTTSIGRASANGVMPSTTMLSATQVMSNSVTLNTKTLILVLTLSLTLTLNPNSLKGKSALFSPGANVVVAPSDKDPVMWDGDLLVVGVYQNCDEAKEPVGTKFTALGEKVDDALGGALTRLAQVNDFEAKPKSFVSTMVLGDSIKVKHIALVGMGKEEVEGNNDEGDCADNKGCHRGGGKCSSAAVNGFGSALASLARDTKCETMSVILPNMKAVIPQAMVAFYSGLYKDVRYKSESDKNKPLKLHSVDLMGAHMKCKDGVDRVVSRAQSISEGVNVCKDLVNAPANTLNPVSLADAAKTIAETYGLKCVVLEKDEIVARGMGAFLGVAQGSGYPPKFIHLTYSGRGAVKRKLAIIGKGITFDSGGYNLKVGAGCMIEKMKFDMGGAGAVLGTARAIGDLAPEGVEVHFIIAACENMLSDKAQRPGDIVTASNGKTIEVLNTDAEGRLTLADALVYAESLGVDSCVDCATLTGAIVVALGKQVCNFA